MASQCGGLHESCAGTTCVGATGVFVGVGAGVADFLVAEREAEEPDQQSADGRQQGEEPALLPGVGFGHVVILAGGVDSFSS